MERKKEKAREELGRSDAKQKMNVIEHSMPGFLYKTSQLILKATLQVR